MARLARTLKNMPNIHVNQTAELVIIAALILYIAFFIHSVPLDFLMFFDNNVVKIVSLVVIAFVGYYSAPVALFLAIAFIATLQTSQRKRLMTVMAPQRMTTMRETLDKKDGVEMVVKEEKEKKKEEDKKEKFYVRPEDRDNISGFNLDMPCIADKNGLQCNQVMTYQKSCGAQGLGSEACPIPGLQTSVGAPFECDN